MTRPEPEAVEDRRYRPGVKYILMLGALAALPAFTTDMYLPSLPAVAADLDAGMPATQLTISGTLLGAAVGQLVIGPFSDRRGRRLPLLIGITLHIVISMLCAAAPNIDALIALRVLQGFFNAAAAVVAIAVIRDRFNGSDAARLLSRLMLVIGLAPLLAPTVGQAVASVWQWQAVFFALALIGLALLGVVWKWMPETLPRERRRSAHPRAVFAGYRTLFTDGHFLAMAAVPGLSMGIIMSYVVGSPFVFQQEYGLTPGQFAAIFAVNGVAMVLFSQANAALVRRFSPMGILRTAVVAEFILTLLLPVVLMTGFGGVLGVIGCLWLLLGTLGFIMPNSSVLALSGYGHMAGSAAAVLGSLQVGIAGVVSPLVGVLGGNALAMAWIIIGCGTLILIIVAVQRTGAQPTSRPIRPRTRASRPAESGTSSAGLQMPSM